MTTPGALSEVAVAPAVPVAVEAADADVPVGLEGLWRSSLILKRDVFSTVERGYFRTPAGEVEGVLRRLDRVPWWTRIIAGILFRREARALAAVPAGIAPPLLYRGRAALVRGWLDGLPLHLARPTGDVAWFRRAKASLHALHRAGITHNDLAKQQNWLAGPDGTALLIDFQLASRFRRRGKLFRVAAYEDLRHLLKHKRTHVPEALTPREKRILARKSIVTRVWMATVKPVYRLVTRRLLKVADREGAGLRLAHDAPRIASILAASPTIAEAAVLAYPDRRSGTGLYAFVETRQPLQPSDMRWLIGVAAPDLRPPELIQTVRALPRDQGGRVRTEILQLIATNQVDLVPPLIGGEAEARLVADIIRERANLRDRIAY